jgi:glutamyl-tRNA reductase
MAIIVIGLNHRTSPVTVRERFAFAEDRIPHALEQLRQTGVIEEAVILSTCNRVELYAASPIHPHKALPVVEQFFTDFHQIGDTLNDELYRLSEPLSVEHLFKVACGLDSMVLGETEILGQLKKAYQIALDSRHTGRQLNKAFQHAFNVAKHIRTDTNIQRGSTSVGAVAVELAEKIFESLKNRRVMVIGAGETSEKTARALMSRGAHSIIVANRTYDRAVELATLLGGSAVKWERFSEAFAEVDIVISSTAAPRYILDRSKLQPLMKSRRDRPLLLIDIAVPRDIEPEVNQLEGVYLYNIDDLQGIAQDYLQRRQAEALRCEQIIRGRAEALLKQNGVYHRAAPLQPAFSS